LADSEPSPLLVFLWYTPEDWEFANLLSKDLKTLGFDVTSTSETEKRDEPSFTIDWQLSKSGCVIFLISKKALSTPILQTEAEKVMRRKEALLIPAYLDDLNAGDLPLLLQYIQPVEFFGDSEKAFDLLHLELNRKIQGKSSTLRKANQPWEQPLRWIIEHFRRYLTLSPLTFCWQITVENLIISLAITGLIYLIWQPSPRTNLQNITVSTYLWSIIILGPIIETILLQVIPVFIARSLKFKFLGQLIFSIAPFAALHFTRSISAGVGAGIIGGFYSAFTYIHWHSKSAWTAFWVTAFSHGLYNLALFAMLVGEF
jgi:hypothetical protein